MLYIHMSTESHIVVILAGGQMLYIHMSTESHIVVISTTAVL